MLNKSIDEKIDKAQELKQKSKSDKALVELEKALTITDRLSKIRKKYSKFFKGELDAPGFDMNLKKEKKTKRKI